MNAATRHSPRSYRIDDYVEKIHNRVMAVNFETILASPDATYSEGLSFLAFAERLDDYVRAKF